MSARRRAPGFLAGFMVLIAALASSSAAAAAHPPGDLDVSFSEDGMVRVLFLGGFETQAAEDVALQPDGKIVGVGGAWADDGTYFGTLRFLPDGELDTSFDGDGGVFTKPGKASFSWPGGVAVQPDGRIVVAGEGACLSGGCFGLVRYRPNGTLDPTFGRDGVVTTAFPGCCTAAAYDVGLIPDGKIVAVGRHFKGGDAQDDEEFGVARYLPNGDLDATFSGDGRATVDFGYGDDLAWGVAVQPDGKVLAAGEGTENLYETNSDLALARFTLGGQLDTGFSADGRQTTNTRGERLDRGYGVDIDDQGRIVVGGDSSANFYLDDRRFAVARYLADGSPDPGFSGDGKLMARIGPYGSWGQAIAVDGEAVLVAGAAYVDSQTSTSDWVVLRMRSDGTPDPLWSDDGIAVSSFGTGADWAAALAVQPDGKVVTSGEVYASFAVARYLGD